MLGDKHTQFSSNPSLVQLLGTSFPISDSLNSILHRLKEPMTLGNPYVKDLDLQFLKNPRRPLRLHVAQVPHNLTLRVTCLPKYASAAIYCLFKRPLVHTPLHTWAFILRNRLGSGAGIDAQAFVRSSGQWTRLTFLSSGMP